MKKNLKKLIVLFTCLTILLSVSMVQVYAAPSISAKKVSVYVGKTKQLKVSGTSTSVKWTTSNSKIVTVSSKGLIKRKKAGKAIVTATTSDKQLKCAVTVKNITASGWQAGGITGVNTNSGQCVMCEVTGVINVSAIFDFGNSAGAIAGINEGTVSSCSTTSGIKLVGYGSGIVA